MSYYGWPCPSTQSPSNRASMEISGEYALASLRLLQMELDVSVQQANVVTGDGGKGGREQKSHEVELSASLKDMALCDEQPSQKGKKTG